jgi:asparagine synthase (glutamine-hydrolysing)
MAWIGGIFSKAHMSQGKLSEKLGLMIENVCPADQSRSVACPRSTCSVLDDVRGQALVQVSVPSRGTASKHACAHFTEKPTLVCEGHLYSLRGTEPDSPRVQRMVNQTTAESLADLVSRPPGNLEQRVKKVLPGLDGDYALAVSAPDQMLIARDDFGTKPLYFAENTELSAFASSRKPLWKVGLAEVKPLRARTLAVFDHEGIGVAKCLPLRQKAIEMKSMAEAVNAYEQALLLAVRKRLAAVNCIARVGVLLSGGVDSCLLARLVRDIASGSGIETIAYATGLSGSPDVAFAQEFARELNIKHKMKTLDIDMVEEYIPEVVEAIEDSDFVQVETGVGLYAAIEMASQDGISVLFSGQGPDELWGGYTWYPKVLGKDGREELCRRMRDDLARVDVETLDRENKIAMTHGVELFFPYLDRDVANTAMSVASEVKVTSEEDHLGKHPHRQLAIKVGIPDKYANREKLAIQHGTCIHGVLDGIARRNGFDPALVKNIGYKNEKVTTQKMGSSARYGYRYIDRKLWQVPQHVQLFLHGLAYRKGLLDVSVSDRVGHFLEKARLSSNIS